MAVVVHSAGVAGDRDGSRGWATWPPG